MDSCYGCQSLTLPSVSLSGFWDSSDQAALFQSLTVQFWWSVAHCSLSFLFFWQKWNLTWSSAVVAHPPQGLCCAFWDAFLLTTIVCQLNLTSLINKVFLSVELPLTGLLTILSKRWKSQKFSRNTQNSLSGTNDHAMLKMIKITFFT